MVYDGVWWCMVEQMIPSMSIVLASIKAALPAATGITLIIFLSFLIFGIFGVS